MDRKTKGNLAESKAISYLIQNEYEVFLPFSENGSVDLLAIKDSKIYRISVKATSTKTKSGKFKATIKTVSRRKENKVKINVFDNTKVDKLLIYIIPNDEIIEINTKDIKTKNEISVESKLG